MAIPLTQLGGKAFNHSADNAAEVEYDRLRDLAREEARKRGSCFDRAHQAYERGDGAGAKELSNEGKRHAAKMDEYNKQASDFIFRENNAVGRVADDTIDLHGQFVEEAEDILEQRIRYAQQHGQTHLHVIVGKGNHSSGHVQKIKPRVEQVCRELGLKYATEENAGRMYINLKGHDVGDQLPPLPPMPAHGNGNGNGHRHGHGQEHGHGHGHGHIGQIHGRDAGQVPSQPGQHHDGGQQHHNQGLVDKVIAKVTKKLGDCCVVM